MSVLFGGFEPVWPLSALKSGLVLVLGFSGLGPMTGPLFYTGSCVFTLCCTFRTNCPLPLPFTPHLCSDHCGHLFSRLHRVFLGGNNGMNHGVVEHEEGLVDSEDTVYVLETPISSP